MIFLIRFFSNVGEEKLKKHYHHLGKKLTKKMSSTSKGQPKKNHITLMCDHVW
jgi:hypothetical protein